MEKKLIMTACILAAALLTSCENETDPGNFSSQEAVPTYVEQSQAETEQVSAELEDFPIIYQEPELPTGCEITASAMLLSYYGYDVDKVALALDYLPTVPYETYYNEEGRLCGSDMENFFVGDPTQPSGYICGVPAAITAINGYLGDRGSELYAEDKTGISLSEIYGLVDEGTPVQVWVTIDMESRMPTDGWYREDGTYMEWSSNDHSAVLIGYDEDSVVIADPISGRYKCSKNKFESVFESRGNKCLILRQG